MSYKKAIITLIAVAMLVVVIYVLYGWQKSKIDKPTRQDSLTEIR